MTRPCNLISVVDAKRSMSEDDFAAYMQIYGVKISKEDSNGGLKSHELDCLISLCLELAHCKNLTPNVFDKYFLGYVIPQIGKEFDLLRMGNEDIIDIELKSQDDIGKIKQQLKIDKHFLSPTGKNLKLFSYIREGDKSVIYKLNDSDEVIKIGIEDLCAEISLQSAESLDDLNTCFDPTCYLVSPFNNVDKFIEGKYFLTQHQEQIKREVIDLAKNGGVCCVTGAAGTGKTLLIYDIAKSFIDLGKCVMIFHCANLNSGQIELISKHGWSIFQAKEILVKDTSDAELIIIDEAQRARYEQFLKLQQMIGDTVSKRCCYIFSYDQMQYLYKGEHDLNIPSRIAAIGNIKSFMLTAKIRTNPGISSFIRALTNKHVSKWECDSNNIEIYFVNDRSRAKYLLEYLQNSGWKVLQYTPSKRDTPFHYEDYRVYGVPSAHAVIGQEFDNVAAVIDETFCYAVDGKLSSQDLPGKTQNWYDQERMLFQILTRTRKQRKVEHETE